MVAFGTVKEGDVLYDVHRERAGNTAMTRLGCWEVKIISVDPKTKTAMASWNGNEARRYYEHDLKRLRRSRPKDK